MDKIRGVKLGNWLVLEKWMSPSVFSGTYAEDETWLNRDLSKNELRKRLKQHRDNYVTLKDFEYLKNIGINTVRIPIPYFIFGDYKPYDGCIEYLDKAFDWAESTGIKILIDLHTTPSNHNGYDNGGLVGVCKFHTKPGEVNYVLSVLERLAKRYGQRDGLFGIEVLNEPISFLVYLSAPTTGKARNRKEAIGSGYVPVSFLKKFYKEAYKILRKYLPEDKAIVFHDGFRLGAWKSFFIKNNMKNVYLDTHMYIWALEMFFPIHKLWVYRFYLGLERLRINLVQKYVPVIVGEWTIANHWSCDMHNRFINNTSFSKAKKNRYRKVAKLELNAFKTASGWFYWSYQLYRDHDCLMDRSWKDGWDLRRCLKNGWMPKTFTK